MAGPFLREDRFERVFARFDKDAKRYLAVVHLASALIWLK